MAAPSHRHQSSLEGIIDFGETGPIFKDEQERDKAIDMFGRIVDHLEEAEPPVRYGQRYNRPALVRLTYEYARSPESKDRFLGAFLKYLALKIVGDDGVNPDIGGAMAILGPLVNNGKVASLGPLVFNFADELINYFFLPLRASTCQTPQPTPPFHAAIQQVHSQEEQQRMRSFVGTPERLGTLRGLCLARDRYRCVITRHFDVYEMLERQKHHPHAQDDDGNDLRPEDGYSHLEVAHIIPFSLTREKDGKLSDSQNTAIAILNMFDVGVMHLIENTYIDRLYNAITLTLEMYREFGEFRIYFERPVDNTSRDTYDIRAFFPFNGARLGLPIRRTFFHHPTIDPPLERLLALHSAIGHILHLSAAGDYIDKILRDMEDGVVREDGSTQLGAMVQVALQIKG